MHLNGLEVLMVPMLMGHPSHMGVPLESIFGHTQVDMILTLHPNSGHVLVIPIVPTPLLHTLEMTIYYCETGLNSPCCSNNIAISDPLWDGQQCDGAEAPCCTHPNLPWFNKTLNEITIEDIEVRVCGDQPTSNEDTPLQVIELYVH